MFKSIRSKLITIMALIMLFTAAVILYFTHREVGREIMRSEQKNVENIMDSVFLNIQGVYWGLLLDRVSNVTQNRERLTRETGAILSSLELYMPDTGFDIGDGAAGRKQRFLAWLGRLDLGTTSFFVANEQYEIIFDSDETFISGNLAGIADIKGQPLSDIINPPGAFYNKFAVFSASESGPGRDADKLGYLTVIPEWGWVLGAVVDISHIRATEEERLKELTQRLGDQFREVRIAGSGSVFIFNSDGEMVVPPAGISDTRSLARHFPDLVRDAPGAEQTSILLNNETMIAYTQHFRPLDWYLSALIPEAEIRAPAKDLVRRQSWIISGIFLLGALAAVFFVRHLSRPLGVLADQARSLARDDLTSDSFDSSKINDLTKKYHDEVGALAGAFMFMQSELRKNVRQLLVSIKANERIESELKIARTIQMNFLPKLIPPYTNREEFEVFAVLEPAKHIGGDLYDFFLLDKNRLFFSVGDVSDKGVPAALFMAVTKTLMKGISEQKHDVSEVLFKVNNELCQGNDSCMFVTLFCGILDLRTGELQYSNAGHNPPVLKRDGEPAQWMELPPGMVLGGIEEVPFQTSRITLKPGDMLLAYTDGVTEAMNPAKALYSDERLMREIQARTTADPEALVTGILETVRAFSGNAPQSDDITLMGLLYKGGR